MRNSVRIFLLLCMVLLGACAEKNDNRNKGLRTIVTGYGPFGEMVLDVNSEDMRKAGFTPGDCISATIDGNEFANARGIATTGMAEGVLFRSASPFDNLHGRAPFVSAFLKEHGVKTALNLTDNADMIGKYTEIPDYSKQMIETGNAVLCKVDANYRGEAFNRTLVSGLIEMMNHPAPYVVHCTEGKDRTGYACALLEALAGASYDEICDDYLVTYDNYFHITPENNPKACSLLLELRLDDAMMFFCGIDDASQLRTIDLSQAMQQHLLRYGMSIEQVRNLKDMLTR